MIHQQMKRPPQIQPDISKISTELSQPAIVQLQRQIGNQAVQRLLYRQRKSMVLQRQDDSEQPVSKTGIAENGAVGAFSKDAYDYINDPKNAVYSFSRLAIDLGSSVNITLAKARIPPVTINIGGTDDLGTFSPSTWAININTQEFSASANTVCGLTPDEAAEIVDTLYHEIRHAEQSYRIARMLAGQWAGLIKIGVDPAYVEKIIRRVTGLPVSVIQQAMQNPLQATPDSLQSLMALVGLSNGANDEMAEAQTWYQSYLYNDLIYSLMDIFDQLHHKIENVDANNVNNTILSIQFIISELDNDWMPKIKEKVKEGKTLSASHQKMVELLGELETTTERFIKTWNDFTRAPKSDRVQQILAMLPTIELILEIRRDAYENLPEEADAHSVGEKAALLYQVRDQMTNLANILMP
jgi:hypothetical protein